MIVTVRDAVPECTMEVCTGAVVWAGNPIVDDKDVFPNVLEEEPIDGVPPPSSPLKHVLGRPTYYTNPLAYVGEGFTVSSL